MQTNPEYSFSRNEEDGNRAAQVAALADSRIQQLI
jgi:hypothetical protein